MFVFAYDDIDVCVGAEMSYTSFCTTPRTFDVFSP